MRIVLAALCLVSAGLLLRVYDPADPITPSFLLLFGGLVVTFLGLGVLLLTRPRPRVYDAAAWLGAVLGLILMFAWYLGHYSASTPTAAAEWDAWILPFIALQFAIVVLSRLARRGASGEH